MIMRRAAVATTLFLVTLSLSAQTSAGDAAWARRGEGAAGARAQAGPVDAAIAAYGQAVRQDPSDLEARWKLMRALRFKGVHAAAGVEEQKRIFDEAKKTGQAGIAQLDAIVARSGAKSVAEGKPAQVAAVLRGTPHAGSLLYWDAASWGEWALVYGKMAAVRQGAADRIRQESTIVMLMDPRIEEGGGARILGRLHHQTPRVPFVTGWASNAEAVKLLDQSLRQDPANKLTKVFLAEAIADQDSKARPRAVEMLREVIAAPADPAFAVEDADAAARAKRLLSAWGA